MGNGYFEMSNKVGKDLFGIGGSGQAEKKRDERRAFTQTQKNEILFQQNNKCANCHNFLDPRAIEFDHIKAWADKGRTVTQNGAALCKNCHGIKTHKDRLKKVDKKRKGGNNKGYVDPLMPNYKLPDYKLPNFKF